MNYVIPDPEVICAVVWEATRSGRLIGAEIGSIFELPDHEGWVTPPSRQLLTIPDQFELVQPVQWTILGAAHVGLISNDGAFKTEVLQIVVKNRHARSHLASCATSSVVHMSPLMTVQQIFVKTFQTYVRNQIANFPQFSWAVHISGKRKNWKRLCMHKLNSVRPTPRPLCQQQMQHSCKDLVYMIVGNSSG